MSSGRKQEYTELNERFLPRLNEELREVWLKLNQLEQFKPFLAGPDRVRGAGRRMALIRYNAELPADAGAVKLDTLRVPLDGRYCLDGAPNFQKVDWMSEPTLYVVNIALGGNYKGHAFEIDRLDEEAATLGITRDYTGGTVPAWTIIVMFAVSGIVARV